jgi:hypothetical protein
VQKTICDLTCLVEEMERSLEAMTDLCLFFKKDCVPVTIKVDDERISSNNQINVLGVIFDSKLQWGPHIRRAIAKSNKSLNAIKLIRRFFTSAELM